MKKALVLLVVAVGAGIAILKMRNVAPAAASVAEGASAARSQTAATAPVVPSPLNAAQPAKAQAVPRAVAKAPPKVGSSPGVGIAARPALERTAVAQASDPQTPPALLAAVGMPAPAASPSVAAPHAMLLSSTTSTEKPRPTEAHASAATAAVTPAAAASALEKAAALMKEEKYVEARAVLNKPYFGSHGEQAAKLREVLDQVNKELIFNPRSVDGAVVHVVQPKERLTSIAKQYHVNWRTLQLINGMTGDRLRAGQKLKVIAGPASAVAFKNEFRLALLLGGVYVKEYPIAVGRDGSETPNGMFVVDVMQEKPRWYKPGGGLIEYGQEGNMLGERWIGFANQSGAASLGIHGTNDETTIRTKCSNGCIRMRNADVIEFYNFMHPGSRVEIRD
jgi:lipoprotein-anchoring transpeptidase ErfK/SrfK